MERRNKRLVLCLIVCVGIISIGPLSNLNRQWKDLLFLSHDGQESEDILDIPQDVEPSAHLQIESKYSFPDKSEPFPNKDFTHINGPITGYPFKTNKDIASQTTIDGVIQESQNLHFKIFNDLIGQYPYIVLVDLATHENKGDSAIGVGETLLIRRLQKELIFYCQSNHCGRRQLSKARDKALQLGRNNVAVLCHGGGNMVSYPLHDEIRYETFKTFVDFKIVVFPQSIWLHSKQRLWEGKKMYSKYPNVTILIRDAQSLSRAREHFSKNNLILTPDIAFQIGSVPRSLRPLYDIIWIKRADGESSRYITSNLNKHGLTVMVDDWIQWMPSNGFKNTMEKINVASEMGFTFLQRGRVAITDRLHVHILATLLHMPHVLLDTSDKKLAAYHNTWTKGLEGSTVLTAKTPQDALDKAVVLLERFKDTLPKIYSNMDLTDGEV